MEIDFTFPPGRTPPDRLYIYDRLATLEELQKGGSNSIATATHTTNGVYLFPAIPLNYRQRYYALFPTNITMQAGPAGNWGGGHIYRFANELHEGGYGTLFKATFESDPYFIPLPPPAPPATLELTPFYTKYLDASGIPTRHPVRCS